MLKALIKKQLYELVSIYVKKGKNGKTFSAKSLVLALFLILLLFFAIGISFVGIGMGLGHVLIPAGLGNVYFAFTGFLAASVSIIVNALTTYSLLYVAKDNEQLLSLPIKPSKILFARMLSVYIVGIAYEAVVIVPAVGVYFYLAVKSGISLSLSGIMLPVLSVISLSLIILALICILGWLVALAMIRLKNNSVLTAVFGVLFIGLVYFGNFKLSSLLADPEEIIRLAEGAKGKFDSVLYPLGLLGDAMTGDIKAFLILFAINAAVLGIVYYVISASFSGIATKKYGAKQVKYVEKKARRRSPRKALLMRELRRFTGIPTYLMNGGLGLVLITGFAVIGLIKMNDLRAVFETVPEIGSILPIGAAVIISVMTGMDAISSPSISLEGNTLWILRSLPVSAADILESKICTHLFVNLYCVVVGSVSFGIIIGADAIQFVMIFAYSILFDLLSAVSGLWFNIVKHDFSWTSEAVPVKQGISVLYSLLLTFGVNGAVGVLAIFLPGSFSRTLLFGIAIILIGAAALCFRYFVMTEGIRRFESM